MIEKVELVYVLINVIIYIISFFLAADMRYMSTWESIYKNFGSQNILKSIIILITIVTSIVAVSYRIKYKIKDFYKKLIVAVIGTIINIIIILLNYQQCVFDMCTYNKYNKYKENAIKHEEEIKFIGIGDIQINMEINKGLTKAKCNQRKINEMIDTENNTPHFALTAGDCTQNGQDGRYIFFNNSLGDYEYIYHNKLKIPMYECLGNHDHDATTEQPLFFRKNPTKQMIKRLNKVRPNIYKSDEHGNYSIRFEHNGTKLLVIFIDTWPSERKMYSSQSKRTGIEFLKESLIEIEKNEKWIMVTHWVPNPIAEGMPQEQFPASNTFNIPDFEEFYEIYMKNKSTCVCVMHGHLHVYNLEKTINADGCTIYCLPSPKGADIIGDEIISEIAEFTYNFNKQELTVDTHNITCKI